MKLYDTIEELTHLEAELEDYAAEHEGDITDFPLTTYLEQLEMERDKKLLGIGCWIKNLMAEAEAIKMEEQKQAKRRKALENKSDNLKSWIALYLSKGERLSDSRCVLSWRKSEQVHIDADAETLPMEFKRIKYEAKKKELKKYIKAGNTVSDVKLVTNHSLQVN